MKTRSLVEKNRSVGIRLAGLLRIGRNLVRAWIAYFVAIRPAVRSGSVVVGDRWLYGYVAQPLPLKFYGPEWVARAMEDAHGSAVVPVPLNIRRGRAAPLQPETLGLLGAALAAGADLSPDRLETEAGFEAGGLSLTARLTAPAPQR